MDNNGTEWGDSVNDKEIRERFERLERRVDHVENELTRIVNSIKSAAGQIRKTLLGSHEEHTGEDKNE